jgi:calcineurin-like phosphoesterase family protein
MTDFYTADTHFGHRNIIGHCGRPWPDVDAMNEGLVERWNSVVTPTDRVHFVGDFTLRERDIFWVQRLNGEIILYAGNHDSCWSGHKKKGKARRAVQTYLDAGFAEVHDSGVLRNHILAGKRVVDLAHLPYSGDHTEVERYTDRRPEDQGKPLICGHVHTAWSTQGKCVNVGVDVHNWTPVHEDEVLKLVEAL